ncbi:hypothetical protein GGR56DRAFT_213477 [Xylariaceae sp. FL0804]|nr:hypothetical protein GGR56DRAFT_213477 [Xylariaceae sp. FL0804]
MSGFLICRSMRRRPDWASLPSALALGHHASWKEMDLTTHDVALPIPTRREDPSRVLRVVCLSPQQVGSELSRRRVERLCHLNGGRDVAVVLLLGQRLEDDARESPVAVLMRLQLDLADWEMPIIPVDSVAAAEATLAAYHRQLVTGGHAAPAPSPVHSLLPYCSDGQPLSEHTVHVLTDITSSLADMLDKISDAGSRSELAGYLEHHAESISSFWSEEYLAE